MAKKSLETPQPPTRDTLPLIHASTRVEHWLAHYWNKLNLPHEQLRYLAITESRQEFAEWTGRRLQSMALGCYCYLPLGGSAVMEEGRALGVQSASTPSLPQTVLRVASRQPTLPGFGESADSSDDAMDELGSAVPTGDYRHLIFIEPGMLDRGIEVTVAHELIHLADRVQGRPRKHRCHGNDSISVDEAAITGRDAETLRRELEDETQRREDALRRVRPYKYFYYCSRCKRNYPRVRRYARPVSCGHCFRSYNPDVLLHLRLTPDGPDVHPAFATGDDGADGGESLTQ